MKEDEFPICTFTDIKTKRVIWEMTSRCTRSCHYCFVPQERKKEHPASFSMIINAMDKLKDIGYTDVQATGGEFFLRKDSVLIVQELHSRGFSIAISTNGDLLTGAILDAIMPMSIRSINLSLDSHIPSINNLIRGQNAFENTIRAIKWISRFPVRIRIHSVLTQKTRDHIHETPFFLHELGVRLHVISAQFPCVETYDEPLATRLISTINQLHDMKILPLRIPLGRNQKPSQWKACRDKKDILHIAPSGTISRCSLSMNQSLPNLNIFTDDLETIRSALEQYENTTVPDEENIPCYTKKVSLCQDNRQIQTSLPT